MPTALPTLIDYLDNLLTTPIQDYCPNGLQVEGRLVVKKIITGVSACQALLDAAIAAKADAILVHHGYFWKGESPIITGSKKRRLAQLLRHDTSLIAYHLPLDIHPIYGNNARLAEVLNVNCENILDKGVGLVWQGQLVEMMSGTMFSSYLHQKLNRSPLHIAGSDRAISNIAWCTGAGQDYIHYAISAGCDAFLTGEVSERTVHIAREAGIHFYAAGHHATERFGIQALGEHLSEQFSITHQFIDVDNPV
jgi:dinuclear metal center YbgI/SA1388 family protein